MNKEIFKAQTEKIIVAKMALDESVTADGKVFGTSPEVVMSTNIRKYCPGDRLSFDEIRRALSDDYIIMILPNK